MKPKHSAKPETKKPETKKPDTVPRANATAPRANATPPRANATPPRAVAMAPRTRPAPPRQQGPRAPHGRAPEDPESAQSLEATREQYGPNYDAGPNVAYPLFPELAPGTVETIRVFRTTARSDGLKGLEWHRQSLPWVASLTTWDDIARICGGGRFVVQAIADSRVVTTTARTFDGPSRTPTASDVASIAPGLGLAENGQASYETPNGWISIPGLPGPTQAAFIAFQQAAFYARADAAAAQTHLALIVQQMTEKAMKADPGLAVLEQIVQAQRETLDRIYTELNKERSEVTRLKIERAANGDDEAKIRVEAIRKGMDIVDGAAGMIAKKLLDSQTASGAPAVASAGNAATITAGTPSDLGAALARRALEAVHKG